MLDITANPNLFWFSGSLVTLFIMAFHRMSGPKRHVPYVVGSHEYWEDGFYTLLVWPGYLVLLCYHLITGKAFRHG